MIDKLNPQDDLQYPWIDNDGCSHESKLAYLQTEVLKFCGCGDPDSAAIFVRDLLDAINNRDFEAKRKLLPNNGAYYTVLYWLDHFEFTEHGSSVGGSWLTPKGEELLSDLNWCIENELKDDEQE